MSTRLTSLLLFATAYIFVAAVLLYARPESGFRNDGRTLAEVSPVRVNDR